MAEWVPVWMVVIAAVCAYFAGNINPAILISRSRGIDIRAQGSGNAGATNAARALGKKTGILVFGIDVAKGFVCCYAPYRIFSLLLQGNEAVIALLCGLCVCLGHMYPVVFGFRGGKGVATTLGALLAASPVFALVLLGVVIVFTVIFRRVSLSVLIAVCVAWITAFMGSGAHAALKAAGVETGFDYYYGIFRFNEALPLWLVVILALVVWKHRSNIVRLLKGQEPRLSFGGKK